QMCIRDRITTPLYAYPVTDKENDAIWKNKIAATDKENQEIKVRGLLAGGTKVLMPNVDLTGADIANNKVGIILNSYGVGNTSRFATVGNYVYALPVGTNETGAESTVYAQVRGYDKVVYTPTTTVKSSNVAPTAQSAAVSLYGATRSGTDVKFTEQPVVKKAEGYYEVSLANFKKFFIGDPTASPVLPARSMSATGDAGIRFRFADQYGKSDKEDTFHGPTNLMVVSSTSGKYTIGSGKYLQLVGSAVAEANDEIVMSAAKDGKSITVTLRITE
ncbi:MAG: hypothetical protein N3I35_11970, partial [Clostridia bacterium]|nr:hypothetical protein [Clostridia bacterium]